MGSEERVASARRVAPRYRVLLAPAEFPDGSLWFPDRLTADLLAFQRQQMGEYLFSCNFQQDPIDKGTQIFRESWWVPYPELPPDLDHYLLIDPAGDGLTKTTSHTAVVEVAVPAEGYPWYVVRAERWFGTDDRLIAAVFDWDRVWAYRRIGVEMVQLRGLVKTVFAQEEATRRHPIMQKLAELEPHGVKKERRIEGLAPLFALGRILMAPAGLDDLREEYLRFPKGKYRDLLDALAYTGQLLDAPWNPQWREAEEDPPWAMPRMGSGKGYTTAYH